MMEIFMKRLFFLFVVFATMINLYVSAAVNCPAGKNVCYLKIIFARPLDTGGLTEDQRVKLEEAVTEHHDYSVVKVENGKIVEESTTGFFADWGLWAALNTINPFFTNRVDGTVYDSSPSMVTEERARGTSERRRDSLEFKEYEERVKYNDSLKGKEFPDRYTLTGIMGINCKGYAANMFDDNKHGLDK